ncbi:MAG: response regulator [Parachlamydiaceae bacterium]
MNNQKKILIVDDSKLVLSLHANILKKMGFECIPAENGFIGFELCMKNKFDMILTDINMPKMDGYDLTKKIRALDGYSETPIIMISTEKEAQDKSKGFEAGVNVYIVKPVDSEDLMMHVKILLGV